MLSFTLRPATSADLSSINDVDLAANPDHPLTSPVPWPPGFDFHPLFLDRHQHMFQDPKHRYVVAEDATGTIVGFIAWTIPTMKGGVGDVEDEYPEWEPNTPEGTNLEFIGSYVVARAEQKRKYYTEDMYEVEALSVDPKYQRQGIGALLLSHLISSEVEKKPAAVYISSSHEGKGLYERFGWTVLGKHVTDLSHAGIEKPIDLFDMMRKWSGNRAQQM